MGNQPTRARRVSNQSIFWLAVPDAVTMSLKLASPSDGLTKNVGSLKVRLNARDPIVKLPIIPNLAAAHGTR